MRVECPSCRQIVTPTLAINASDVGMTCTSCNTVIPKAALENAVTDDEVAVTNPIPRVKDASCPKCSAPLKEGATACAQCGLAVARMGSFIAEQSTAATEEVRALWDRVIAAWTDEARHEALFEKVAERGEYGWAAGRYREQVRERPNDPIAKKQLERIRRALEATLAVSATARDKAGPKPYKSVTTLLGVLIIVLVVGMFYMFIKSKSSPSDEDDQVQPQPPPPPPGHTARPQVR